MNQYEQLLPKELLKSYEVAPAHVRDLIQSGKLIAVVGALHKKFALHIDVTSKMMTELFMALLGVTRWEALYTALVDNANVPVEHIQEVLQELNGEIFIPLKEKLRVQTTPTVPATAPRSLASTAPKIMPSLKNLKPSASVTTPVPTVTKPTTALETLPPHEITVRTMKNDAVSVKAGEKPSRFILPKRAPEEVVKKPSPISKYLKPLGATMPAFVDTTPKKAFSSRFSSSAETVKPAPVTDKPSPPPQTFLPIKPKDPTVAVVPIKAPQNTGASFIPKTPILPQVAVKASSAPMASPIPPSIGKAVTPLPMSKATPVVPTPASVVASSANTIQPAAKSLDPYREIPE